MMQVGVLRRWGAVGVLSLLGLAAACTRSANQNNFLGKPCTSEGDCPAELMCVVGACREPCGPGGECNVGETCQLGACIPGGTAGMADGGTPTMNGADGGDSIGPGMNGSDGTVVRTGLPSTNDVHMFATDDARIAFLVSETDAFGQQSNVVKTAALNGTDAPITVVSLSNNAVMGVALANGNVYWPEPPPSQPGTTKLMRAPSTQAQATGTQVGTITSKMTYGVPFFMSGDKLVFVDASDQVRLYDTKTSTLDANAYGSSPQNGAGSVAVTDTTIYYVNNGGGGTTGTIYRATIGAAGSSATSRSFPSGQMTSFGAFGTNAYATIQSSGSLLKFDTTSGSTPYETLANVGSNGVPPGGMPNLFFYDAGYLFAVVATQGGGAVPVERISLTDGKADVIGHTLYAGRASIYVTKSFVYALEYDSNASNASRLVRWARP